MDHLRTKRYREPASAQVSALRAYRLRAVSLVSLTLGCSTKVQQPHRRQPYLPRPRRSSDLPERPRTTGAPVVRIEGLVPLPTRQLQVAQLLGGDDRVADFYQVNRVRAV